MSSSTLFHQNLLLCGFDTIAAKRKYGVDFVEGIFMKKGNTRALEVSSRFSILFIFKCE